MTSSPEFLFVAKRLIRFREPLLNVMETDGGFRVQSDDEHQCTGPGELSLTNIITPNNCPITDVIRCSEYFVR